MIIVSCPVLATNLKQKIYDCKRKKKQVFIKVVAVKMKKEITTDTSASGVICCPSHDVSRKGTLQMHFGCRLGCG